MSASLGTVDRQTQLRVVSQVTDADGAAATPTSSTFRLLRDGVVLETVAGVEDAETTGLMVGVFTTVLQPGGRYHVRVDHVNPTCGDERYFVVPRSEFT